MTAIRIEHLTKRYGSTAVVDDVSLDIGSGELFFLLGPSGCGKTTLLRSIAGFVQPDAGEIFFGDRPITRVPPKDRGTGLVFQNYAIWPHMTVSQNIAFGLDVRGVAKAERERRLAEAIALVRLTGFEQSRPAQLSGGQQQRVALARALVIRPDVLLLDEPLSNLDARLRAEMREEIRRIHRETGITTVYVTHDQKEALSLADRMAVMHRGKVEQLGPPRQLYMKPANRFVANFLGDANLIEGQVTHAADDHVVAETVIGRLTSSNNLSGLAVGARVLCCVRPESIRLRLAEDGTTEAGEQQLDSPRDRYNQFVARVDGELFLGEIHHLQLQAGPTRLVSYHLPTHETDIAAGRDVHCTIATRDVVLLPPD